MKLIILFTGKTSISYINDGIADYFKRLKFYIKTEIIIVPDIKNTRSMPEQEIRKKEGENILNAIPSGSYIILLDKDGKVFSSEELAVFFNKRIIERRDICMIIGGAYGFSEDVYSKADNRMSLSKLTFSHQMVRMILLEQIYRAFSILKGEKYHHGV